MPPDTVSGAQEPGRRQRLLIPFARLLFKREENVAEDRVVTVLSATGVAALPEGVGMVGAADGRVE